MGMIDADQLYNIKLQHPNCSSESNGNISITNVTTNNLSIDWLNLPSSAIIYNDGKSVNNLSCGTYYVEIYDSIKKQTYKENIVLDCLDDFSFNFVQMDGMDCIGDSGVLNVSWSGGKAPYTVTINNKKIITSDTNISYDVIPNQKYNLSIIDANKCLIEKKGICKNIQSMHVNVHWQPISHYGAKSSEVYYTIRGGVPPYKVAWFIGDDQKPSIVNQNNLQNVLSAGKYRLVITDTFGCVLEKSFQITSPAPIMVNIRSSADYSANAFYPKIQIKSFYNLVLLRKSDYTFKQLLDSTITIKHKNQSIPQRIIMDHGHVKINNTDYMYFYVNPGISTLTSETSKLIIDNNEISLHHTPNFNNQNKLLVGSAILPYMYDYIFHDSDIVSISNDKKQLNTSLSFVYHQSGLYDSINASTALNFIDSNKQDAKDILELLNNQEFLNQNFIQCLTTKQNQQLGQISCMVYGGDQSKLKLDIVDSSGNTDTYPIEDNRIKISNLVNGKYKIKIYDNNNTAHEYNKQYVEEFYDINIYSSFDEEQENYKSMAVSQYNIDPSLLNVYNKPPSNLLFTSPEFQNGVLINISPSESCYEITDEDGKLIEGCGYGIVNLTSGKYEIKVFCDGYISKEKIFFVNNKKELVTILLDKKEH